jgi:hypothetical protein
MGEHFYSGFCDGPGGPETGTLVSFGSCFPVLTLALPILDAATSGRVSPRRLWDLAVLKGCLVAHDYYGLPGVDYGPISEYWDQTPLMFGDLMPKELVTLETEGHSAEDITDVIRARGFWMWMRPDR